MLVTPGIERRVKCPCSPKWLCRLVLLFWNCLFVECSVLIGCYFSSDNFQLQKFLQCIQGDIGHLTVRFENLVVCHGNWPRCV